MSRRGAVADCPVLLAHEHAFADAPALHAALASAVPDFVAVEAPAARVSLANAAGSYLFNSQLIRRPDGAAALVVPAETRDHAGVWGWLGEVTGGNHAIAEVHVADVRESMRNGGGPACLRLRVQVDPAAHAAIDPRFLVDSAKLDRIAAVVEATWPERIAPADLGHPDLWRDARAARAALLAALHLTELG